MQSVEGPLNDLITACHQGNPKAQERLYRRFYPYAMSLALHYSKDREQAEEIVQDAYVKCFRSLQKERFAGAFKPWFRRIVVNTAIDRYRSEQKRLQTEELTEYHSFSAVGGTAGNAAIESLSQQDLYRILQVLPPMYRLVFNLHALEGYTHPEIAEKLGVSEGTSKSNLYKARRRLKELAGNYFNRDNQVNHG
ncbi:MAG: RNA polymerase sigma factor [Bacteroidota bacterium]